MDTNDFLLDSLPGIIAPYVGEAAVLGVMGWEWVSGVEGGRRKGRWRGSFGWALGWMAVLEIGLRYLWDVRAVDGDCLHVRVWILIEICTDWRRIQLTSTIHPLRTIALLLLPIIYLFLPLPPLQPPLTSLLPALSNAHSILRLTSLSRTAVSRNARLRNAWSHAGEVAARTAKVGREDEAVEGMAREVGVKEEMRDDARRWIVQGWNGLVRVEGHESGT